MQLSLVDDNPEFEKRYFLDVFAEAVLYANNTKIRLETIDGQPVPCELKISCPKHFISKYPEGTIYKLDTKLVRKAGRKPYFIAINGKGLCRAMEFFEYNLKVQNGFK